MRIGIDATPLPLHPGGAGNYILHLVRTLNDQEIPGCQVVVFIHQSGRRMMNLPNDGKLAWVILPDRSPGLRLVWEQVALPRLVRKEKLSLLHSLHYTQPFYLPCASVVTFHDMTFFLYPQLHTRIKRLFFPPMIRWSALHANAILASSESTRRDSIRLLGVPDSKIVTTPLGVEKEFHPPTDRSLLERVRAKYRLPDPFILYVGTVEPRKNLPLLLCAFSGLVRRGYPHCLVVVGQLGWMVEDVFKIIEELGLKDWVLFTGYIPQEDLPSVYQMAEIFVYPTTYEGFGLPVLEAMACGTPVITSNVSSMPEFVGDSGLLVSPGNAEALEQSMVNLIKDRDKRMLFSKTGIERAAAYNWERTTEETIRVYRRILGV